MSVFWKKIAGSTLAFLMFGLGVFLMKALFKIDITEALLWCIAWHLVYDHADRFFA